MKKIISILMSSIIMLSMVACGKSNDTATNVDNMKWEEVLEKAKGSTVTFYGWGGDEELNAWLDDVFEPKMKEKYDIKMERVPMDIDQVLSQLSGEIQAGEEDGSIDMIWINGENFKSAKENNMLYGPFLEKLPNAEKYLDLNADENKYDFGFPTEGYEAPYGKAQLVFMHDSAVTKDVPSSTKELLEFAKANKGKITYPALPDFTGSAFVRNVIYDICGYEQFQDMKEDKETVKKAIEPALDYLVELNKYLWNEGKSFPADSTQLDNMFKDNEVVMNMTYTAYAVARGIENGSYTDSTKTFLFDKGTIGNTNYMAIAKNSGNKAGAMVAINEMISAGMQASRLEKLKTIPVVDNHKLSKEEKAEFDKVDIGKGTIPQDELLSKRLPEMPAGLVPIIEEIWLEEVVGK
ncbi:ABC transporter substrate-binding protein [Terrisporobacter mayombei]|uniref:Protein YnjB n=1 Tax=Terrisporobacter mayombei TaxID=1541 RepID=A0ABY9PVU0_9FIRM|nr:ABC transporter substrate-binding protein [Terrisporobacter mayombei]MCC3869918.1 ABC transporter substrate-binding protein [Terrisporobacter mayombei]WMT79808.1 Protein YnjB [Terrisporobacter mayombei]